MSDSPQPSATEQNASRPRTRGGCATAILYICVFFLGVGLIVVLVIPLLFPSPDWNQYAIGRLIGQVAFYLSIPVGLYGFLRGRGFFRGGRFLRRRRN